MKKPNGYWNKEHCKLEALKYKTKSEFKKMCPSAYSSSIKNRWLESICCHMKKPLTKFKCKKIAMSYNDVSNFYNKERKLYLFILRRGWLDELCCHMINKRKKRFYWTKEKCKEVSLKYLSRTEFQINEKGAYTAAQRNGWLDDIYQHMERTGHRYKRCIYSIEFPDNHVYVGLTYNFNQRKNQHLNNFKSVVFKYILETGLKPEIKKLTEYLDCDRASLEETKFLNFYINNNWNILNKKKTGELGNSGIIWTKEKCNEVATRCTKLSEFRTSYNVAYQVSIKNNWLDEISSHMNRKKRNGYWNKEHCKLEALKYKTKSEFKKMCPSAYRICYRNKWFDILNNFQ